MVVTTVTSLAEFEEKKKKGIVTVDFYATWCGPCKTVASAIDKMSEEYKDVVFLKVDVDDRQDIATQEKIECMPTFKIFKNGALSGTVQGAMPAQVKQAIEKARQG